MCGEECVQCQVYLRMGVFVYLSALPTTHTLMWISGNLNKLRF